MLWQVVVARVCTLAFGGQHEVDACNLQCRSRFGDGCCFYDGLVHVCKWCSGGHVDGAISTANTKWSANCYKSGQCDGPNHGQYCIGTCEDLWAPRASPDLESLLIVMVAQFDGWQQETKYWNYRDNSWRNWLAHSSAMDNHKRAVGCQHLRGGALITQLEKEAGNTFWWKTHYEYWAQHADHHRNSYAADICGRGNYLFIATAVTLKGWALEVDRIDMYLVPIIMFSGSSSGKYTEEKTVKTGYSSTSHSSSSSTTIATRASGKYNAWRQSYTGTLDASVLNVYSSCQTQTQIETVHTKKFEIDMAVPCYIYVGKMRVITRDGSSHSFSTDAFVQRSTPAQQLRTSIPV